MLISHLDCELCKVRDLLWNFFVYSAPWWTLSMYLQNEWMLPLACFFFVHVSIYYIFHSYCTFHASANPDQKVDLSQLRQKQTFKVLSKPQWLVSVAFCTLRTAQEGVSTRSSPHVGPASEDSPGVYTQVRQSVPRVQLPLKSPHSEPISKSQADVIIMMSIIQIKLSRG